MWYARNTLLTGLIVMGALSWSCVRNLQLAVDAAQAGIGDKVLLVIEGRAAGQAVRRRAAPVDAAIVGVIDSVTRYERD